MSTETKGTFISRKARAKMQAAECDCFLCQHYRKLAVLRAEVERLRAEARAKMQAAEECDCPIPDFAADVAICQHSRKLAGLRAEVERLRATLLNVRHRLTDAPASFGMKSEVTLIDEALESKGN